MQKCETSFADGQKICGVVFDIEKAFDKVWHQGLLFKLHKICVPMKIGIWIKGFLNKRKFFVSLNGCISLLKLIHTGVPQGAILSPLLFLIFVNDIPKVEHYDTSESLLYGDDLFHFYADKNINRIKIVVQKYFN